VTHPPANSFYNLYLFSLLCRCLISENQAMLLICLPKEPLGKVEKRYLLSFCHILLLAYPPSIENSRTISSIFKNEPNPAKKWRGPRPPGVHGWPGGPPYDETCPIPPIPKRWKNDLKCNSRTIEFLDLKSDLNF